MHLLITNVPEPAGYRKNNAWKLLQGLFKIPLIATIIDRNGVRVKKADWVESY